MAKKENKEEEEKSERTLIKEGMIKQSMEDVEAEASEVAENKGDDERSFGFAPEQVRDFRIAYDSKCREGIPPKSMKDFMVDPHENTIPMAWAYYVLEFWETCVIWPPQSRIYAKHPDLGESDKS
jgi:hypothetical protein